MNFGGGKRVMALFGMGVLTFVVGVIASTGIGGVLAIAADWVQQASAPANSLATSGSTAYNTNVSGPGLIETLWNNWTDVIMALLGEMFQLRIESAAMICIAVAFSAMPVLLIAPVCKRWQPGEEGRSLRG